MAIVSRALSAVPSDVASSQRCAVAGDSFAMKPHSVLKVTPRCAVPGDSHAIKPRCAVPSDPDDGPDYDPRYDDEDEDLDVQYREQLCMLDSVHDDGPDHVAVTRVHDDTPDYDPMLPSNTELDVQSVQRLLQLA